MYILTQFPCDIDLIFINMKTLCWNELLFNLWIHQMVETLCSQRTNYTEWFDKGVFVTEIQFRIYSPKMSVTDV